MHRTSGNMDEHMIHNRLKNSMFVSVVHRAYKMETKVNVREMIL